MLQNNTQKQQQGMSLLEVLISFFVLGVGILGVLSLQAQALKLNTQSYSLSQAVFLASDIAERIRVNKTVASSYAVSDLESTIDNGFACESTDGGCNNLQDIRNQDLKAWAALLKQTLPNGKGTISGTPPDMLVTIEFDSSTKGSSFEKDGWQVYSTVIGI